VCANAKQSFRAAVIYCPKYKSVKNFNHVDKIREQRLKDNLDTLEMAYIRDGLL